MGQSPQQGFILPVTIGETFLSRPMKDLIRIMDFIKPVKAGNYKIMHQYPICSCLIYQAFGPNKLGDYDEFGPMNGATTTPFR